MISGVTSLFHRTQKMYHSFENIRNGKWLWQCRYSIFIGSQKQKKKKKTLILIGNVNASLWIFYRWPSQIHTRISNRMLNPFERILCSKANKSSKITPSIRCHTHDTNNSNPVFGIDDKSFKITTIWIYCGAYSIALTTL